MSKWTYMKEMPNEGRKTKIFSVRAKEDDTFIGLVKWFGAWRKYCFFPIENTVFEQDCLRDIAQFIEEETKRHKLKER